MGKLLLTTLLFFPFLFPSPIAAHAFGQSYTLPIPLWLYLFGGGTAVIVSFLIIGLFWNQSKNNLNYPTYDLTRYRVIKPIITTPFKSFLQIISVLIFSLTILAGFWGDQLPAKNLLPLSFWIFLFLGMTYLSAVVGNIWDVLNPFKIISSFLLKLLKRESKAYFKYPQNWGYLPSLVVYFVLIWLEILSSGLGVIPSNLALILIGYTIFNIVGSLAFGLTNWFTYGEFFSVFFGLIAKIAPLEIRNEAPTSLRSRYLLPMLRRERSPSEAETSSHSSSDLRPWFSAKGDKKIYLRPVLIGLLSRTKIHTSLLVFILFMLSSTAFDGFHSTQTWLHFYYSNFRWLESFLGPNAFSITQPIFLFFSPLFFLTLYLLALGGMKLLVKTDKTVKELALAFALSLLPIALAYHTAHYYTLVLVQGQTIIPLLSDPLNQGWNLLGTLSYKTNPGIVGARFVWNSQVVVIVAGHIASVYLAHLLALNSFTTSRKALISQIPMLILMVLYTVTGLWILSQPLVMGE